MQRTRKVSGVNALCLTWIVTVVWYEVGVFYWSVSRCEWPDKTFTYENSKKPATSPSHAILIADPQLIDDNSYPERGYILEVLSRVIVDLNMKKSWRAVRRLLRRSRKREGDAVVFLGDMMDNGRSNYSDAEYEAYFDRFKSIFATDASMEVYYIPGNHDVGLGSSRKFSLHSRSRYVKHFGPLNRSIHFGNHTFVMVDAPGLVEEDYRRSAAGQRFEDWQPAAGGVVDFVNSFAIVGSAEPTVLFSHIPLFRPDTAHCGPLRERGTIRRGVGFGYQNTLGKQTSEFLLNNIQPNVIFGGDDHDYCEYIHSVSFTSEGPDPKVVYVREVTVKSFSIAMGIHNPGFQLLSLADPSTIVPGTPSHVDVPCFLPDQIAIYLNRYLPLFVLTLCILAFSVFRRLHNPKRNIGHYNLDVEPNDISLAECSPESVFPGSLNSTRLLSSSSGDGAAAPSYRVASATFPATPFTPEFTATPGGRAATPGMLTAQPAGLNISPGDAELGYGCRDDVTYHDGEARYTERRARDSAFFAPMLARAPNRMRRLGWSWTFVMAGRRRRLTVGIPSFLEQIVTAFVPFFRRRVYSRVVGNRGGSKSKNHFVGRRSPVRVFMHDFLSAAWPPVIIFAFVNLFILYH